MLTFAGDVVPSVSITNFLNQRAAVLEKMRQAVELIGEAQRLATAAGLGLPMVCLHNGYSRNPDQRVNGDLASDRASVARYIERAIDCQGWAYLMRESGLRSLMDAKARAAWDESLQKNEFPELTRETIAATFERLHSDRGDMFERGVINCFKSLSWDYKTNKPFAFGKRIIVEFIRHVYRSREYRNLASFNHRKCDELDDLVRVFSILDGKPEPDHRNGTYSQLTEAAHAGRACATLEYFSVKWFLNGNGHLTFTRPDLVEKMNAILAKHYPGALPHNRNL